MIANSRYTASLLLERGVRQSRIVVIPPGVDPERFSSERNESRTQEPSTARVKKILFVGRLARRKGVKEFVQRSLPAIVQQISRVQFVIAGDNPAHSLTHAGDLNQGLLAQIAKLNLSDHVRFMGAVDDATLAGLYRECDVVVLPVLSSKSDVEGFGIVLIEAAAAGKPVVATRVGGIPDAVEDGATGFLVEAGDYTGFTEALNKLLTDPLLASEMGRRGQSRIRAEFAWSRVIPRYEAVFEGTVRQNEVEAHIREIPEPDEHRGR
jgi:phosphatidylinositol alpha-1,6-mannosyltransferase